MSTQLRRMIAIPDAQYRKLMSDLKAGKKVYLSDRDGKADRVELRGSDKQIYEVSTGRLVVALSTVSNRSNTKTLSLCVWGKLMVAFGNPVMAKKPDEENTSNVDFSVAWIFVDRSRDDTPILIYHNQQKVLILPEFWKAVEQWKALFGDAFHRDVTLSAIFNDSDIPTSGIRIETPSSTAPKRVARLIKWE